MDKYNIVMPQEVKDIIKQIEAAGFEAFAVGGCVRDCIPVSYTHLTLPTT